MRQFKWRRVLVPLAGAGLAVGILVGSAGAGESAPRQATIVAKGTAQMKVNRFFKETFRFAPGVTEIRSGGRLRLVNKTPAPHTLSIVRRGQLPGNVRQMFRCFEGGVCGELEAAHFPPEGPPVQRVNKGEPGLDRPGDSIFFDDRARIRVSAPRGKTLNYLCAIHPWMQGKIKVG